MEGAEKAEDETTEFFVPRRGLDLAPYIAHRDMQGIHHLSRYHWATRVLDPIAPRRVLDVACGAGYGSFLLADTMPGVEVRGVDYDARAIDYARKAYRAPGLSYERGNLVTWCSEEGAGASLGRFDAILSFDTIEHLLHREIALLRIVEHLEEGGCLLFSTPCGAENKLNPGWEHHKIEYSFSDLRKLLSRFFRTVAVPEDGTLPALDFWQDEVNAKEQLYVTLSNPVFCADPIR